jgi:hypothetical protein
VRNEPQHDHAPATTKTKIHGPLIGFLRYQNIVPFAITMLRFASSPATYNSARNSFSVLRRLPVRNEPQHDHTSSTTKTKIHVPLIGFSRSHSIVPFAITNVAVRKLTSNLHQVISMCLFGAKKWGQDCPHVFITTDTPRLKLQML